MAEDWQAQLAKLGGIKLEEKPQKNFSYNKDKNSAPKKNPPVKNFPPKKNSAPQNISTATAPYNFVSLPEKVLPSEIESVEDFKNHIKNNGNLSGEIELEIETLTPLFIGGNASKSFAPAGKYIIPGSSLRGMFKNIFKVVTCGAFRGSTASQKKGEDFNDEHIYFRCLMAPSNSPKWMEDLCNLYKSRMEGEKGKNARPGFLIQTKDNKYFIAPLLPKLERKNDSVLIKNFFRPVRFKDSCVEWQGNIAYILTGNQWANKPEKLLNDAQYKEYKEKLAAIHKKWKDGFLTDEQHTAEVQKFNYGKQIIRFVKIEYVDWSKRIEIPDEVLTSYEHDRNRRGVNLFKDKGILKREQLKKLCKNLPADVKSLIPCHFLYEGDRVTAFGHGQCFRIPYKNSIGDVVPQNLQDEKIIDFADAVFGRKENWASRVAFEDAAPISEIETLETETAHPLMQPNPTSYQLYLKQGEKILNHWDKDKAQLRGYKFYWHNQIWDWKDNSNARDDLAKKLTPLKKGNNFKSKIRFQNLSAVELGALMQIFNFENAAYKIGMGKPFGFGSIKITPKLFIENENSYTEIFDGDKFKNPYKKVDAAKYLDAFKNYIASQKMSETWQKVIDELQKILDWNKKPAPQKIKSMSGDVSKKDSVDERFKQRAPLQSIFEVVK